MKRYSIVAWFIAITLSACSSVPLPGWVDNAINTSDDEIAACRYGNVLFVLRLGVDGSERLWQLARRADGTWAAPHLTDLSPLQHSRAGKPTIAPVGDGRLLLVFPAHRSLQNIDLAESLFDGTGWSPPRWLDELNSAGWDSQPALSPDGGMLLFVSDRQGNKDLYVSIRTPRGWSAPMPLSVNTGGDEITPAVLPDSSLLFARRRDTTKGDFQLYRALQRSPFHWDTPEPLPEPINSSADDIAPVVWDSLVIISSNRTGDFDLFEFRLCGPVQLYIHVYPSATVHLLDGIVTIASTRTIETISIGASGNGSASLEPCQRYIVQYTNQCSGNSYQHQFTAPCNMANTVILELPISLPDEGTRWERTIAGVFAPDDYLPATDQHRIGRWLLGRYTGELAPIAGEQYKIDTLSLGEFADRIVSIFHCAPSAILQITITTSPSQKPIRYFGAPLEMVVESGTHIRIVPGELMSPSKIALLRAYTLQQYVITFLSQRLDGIAALNRIRWQYADDPLLPPHDAKICLSVLQ